MLNPAQQQAVRAEGHLIVTACPGSGKTKVLEHRASYLLSLPQSKVLGVTFTAESAAELEARIRQRERTVGGRLITGTFHKLSMKLMAQAKIRLKLINDFQQQDFLRRAYKECIGASDGVSFDDAKAYVDALKAQVDPYLPPENENPKVSVYLAYQELLRQTGSSDFADLLLVAVRGMRDGSIPTFDVPFMLVDEFQDTDRVQFEWIKEHIRQGTSVTVVGDDDQSIYEWRHAMGYKGMEDFIHSTQATHVSLDTTYRCAVEIMEPAAKLIAFNEERVPKALNTANRTRGFAGSKACADKDDECLAIATAIGSSGHPEDWAVLARTNAQLEYLERYIAGRIPIIRSGGKSFWELRAPGMFLALCRAVAVEDMGSLDQILKGAGLTESQLSALREECNGAERGAVRRFVAMRKGGSSKDPVERIRVLMAQWYGMLDRNEVSLVLLAMAHYIKTSVQLYNRERKPAEKAKDDDMIDSCAVSLGRASGTLANRIQAVQREREDGNSAATRLMTFHSSKGLEFPNVWIMGCEEGVIPSTNSPVEEERRLFYVGMTRAKLNLQTSYVIDPKAPASRFLGEAGLL